MGFAARAVRLGGPNFSVAYSERSERKFVVALMAGFHISFYCFCFSGVVTANGIIRLYIPTEQKCFFTPLKSRNRLPMYDCRPGCRRIRQRSYSERSEAITSRGWDSPPAQCDIGGPNFSVAYSERSERKFVVALMAGFHISFYCFCFSGVVTAN